MTRPMIQRIDRQQIGQHLRAIATQLTQHQCLEHLCLVVLAVGIQYIFTMLQRGFEIALTAIKQCQFIVCG